MFKCEDEESCMLWINALMRALTVLQVGLGADQLGGEQQQRVISIGEWCRVRFCSWRLRFGPLQLRRTDEFVVRD